MHVVILGAGDMGRATAKVTANDADVDNLIIADWDHGAAESVVAYLHATRIPSMTGPRLRALGVDVTNAEQLRRVLDPADVTLNATGPFMRLGIPVLRAAIATGTDYLDICDDWQPTLEMLALDGEARHAGVTAVIGCGASPGVSNLLAAQAAAKLHQLHDIYTAWPVDVGDNAAGAELHPADGRPSAAIVHWMLQISGLIRVVENGHLADRPPLTPVELTVPNAGGGTAYTVGHPEPLTLHRTLSPNGSAACLMVITPGTLCYLDGLRADLDSGRLTPEQAAQHVLRPSRRRKILATLAAITRSGPGTLPPFFALARGLDNASRRVDVGATLTTAPQGMAASTGIPLALALRQHLDGRLHHPGVHPPEGILDADMFFQRLARHCTPAADPSMLVAVSVGRPTL